MPHLSQLLAHSREAEQQAPQRAHRLPLLPELLLRLILCQQQGTTRLHWVQRMGLPQPKTEPGICTSPPMTQQVTVQANAGSRPPW